VKRLNPQKLTLNSPRFTSKSPQTYQQITMNLPAKTGVEEAAL
jgi:hypothetical protein